MEEAVLSFGVIRKLSDDMCEVIVNQGVEMTKAMVDEYHAYLESCFQQPFAILVNKQHDYTYTFEAQQHLATLPNIHAIAVVVYRRSSEIAMQALQDVKREREWNLKVFHDRQVALQWLESQLLTVECETN